MTVSTPISETEILTQYAACDDESLGLQYFTDTYVHIENAIQKGWIPFKLWAFQFEILDTFKKHSRVVVLKARQLGLTWLALAYALYLMVMRPSATVLVFSRRDNEAQDLIRRLKGMYKRLPYWLKADSVTIDNSKDFMLSNGSRCLAFPRVGGDSYTANLVIIDEADLNIYLETLLASVEPTMADGGQIIMISRANKDLPSSLFKRIYIAARDGLNEWASLFYAWFARPDRDIAWYLRIKENALTTTGSLDIVKEQHPESDSEALAARQQGKAFPLEWLNRVFVPRTPLDSEWLYEYYPTAPLYIKDCVVYEAPILGKEYVIGADTAQGKETGDYASFHVIRLDTMTEVLRHTEKIRPEVQGEIIEYIGTFYNNAAVLPERNADGSALILYLQRIGMGSLPLLYGHDGKYGWLNSPKGKAMLFTQFGNMLRHGDFSFSSQSTFDQIASLEQSTKAAPEGFHDDESMSLMLAVVGSVMAYQNSFGNISKSDILNNIPSDELTDNDINEIRRRKRRGRTRRRNDKRH